ncbi:MAG: TetR/AcrR family transcriptional regulator [Filomicrobium sp.]
MKQKTAYHHGDLKEALVQASYELVSQGGAENFLLSEACKRAGVSTAAPYKHFRDRDEILEIIVMRAFDELADRSMDAVASRGTGTLDGIVAMGKAYVTFAADEQRLFRLMFGQHPKLKQAEPVVDDGKRCFTQVIEQVGLYCSQNNVPGDPRQIAIRLWTFVHGAASLLIDEDYAVVAPDLDVMAMIEETTPLMLAAPSGAG